MNRSPEHLTLHVGDLVRQVRPGSKHRHRHVWKVLDVQNRTGSNPLITIEQFSVYGKTPAKPHVTKLDAFWLKKA